MQKESDFLKGFEECFGGLKDERQQSKIDYPLIEVLFVTIVAIAGSAFSWETIESVGKYHLSLKKNHVALYNEVEDAFSSNAETFFKMDTAQSKEKSHG